MNYFKEDWPRYNLGHLKGESVSEFSVIDIKTLYDGGFQFHQTGLICKVLEAIGMEHCNGFPTETMVETHLETDKNGCEDKIDRPN